MHQDILRPMVALIGWTLVMLLWLVAARMPAMRAAGIDLRTLVGGRGADADRALPAKAQWPAHNYNHLLEQPTIFYAVCMVIALTATGNGLDAWIAWGYVGLRVAHSLVQATVNRVAVRFALFGLSTACLTVLTVRAALATFG